MTLALLPGSRESEIKTLLPIMLKTAEFILRRKDVQFLLLKSSSIKDSIYEKALRHSSLRIPAIKDNTRGCLSISDFAFTASGTVTLENAIMERPMLITYKTSLLTFILAKLFMRIPHIGLVNIIAGREVVPEILQYAAKPERLALEILSIVSSKEKMEKQIEGLRQVKANLGEPGASLRAARIINDFI